MRPILLLLLVALCLRAEDAKPAEILCTIRVQGGIAGLREQWRVDETGQVMRDGRRVGKVDVAGLRRALDDIITAPTQEDPHAADEIHLDAVIARPDGPRRVESWDGAGPHPLRDLMATPRASAAPSQPRSDP